jgi:hypothetical protein
MKRIANLPIVDCQFETDQSYENWQSAIWQLEMHESTLG